MPNVIQYQMEDSNGNPMEIHTSADNVSFDPSVAINLNSDTVHGALIEINEKAEQSARMVTLTTIIPSSAFSSTAPYYQSIDVDGVLETDSPLADVILSETDSALAASQLEAWTLVSSIKTQNGHIIVRCYDEKPSVDIPIQLVIIR